MLDKTRYGRFCEREDFVNVAKRSNLEWRIEYNIGNWHSKTRRKNDRKAFALLVLAPAHLFVCIELKADNQLAWYKKGRSFRNSLLPTVT